MTSRAFVPIGLVCGVLLSACMVVLGAQIQTPRSQPAVVWAPKPIDTVQYAAPQRPWTKLADLKAAHAREKNWRDVIVDDGRLTGEYIAAAPGTKTDPRFHP